MKSRSGNMEEVSPKKFDLPTCQDNSCVAGGLNTCCAGHICVPSSPSMFGKSVFGHSLFRLGKCKRGTINQ